VGPDQGKSERESIKQGKKKKEGGSFNAIPAGRGGRRWGGGSRKEKKEKKGGKKGLPFSFLISSDRREKGRELMLTRKGGKKKERKGEGAVPFSVPPPHMLTGREFKKKGDRKGGEQEKGKRRQLCRFLCR